MKLGSQLARFVAVASSLTLLAGYVIYTQSNAGVLKVYIEGAGASPISNPLTATTIQALPPPTMMSGSKSLSQPIFSTGKASGTDVGGQLQVRTSRRIMSGSKSGAVELPMPGFLSVEFADFGISLEPFVGFPHPNHPFEETADATVKTEANDPFGTPAAKP